MKVEEMGQFFDKRVASYENHMQENIEGFETFYTSVVDAVPEGTKNILILGCGTGLEVEGLLKRFKHIEMTCIDLSPKMLDKLKRKFSSIGEQINIIQGSYFDVIISQKYDVVMAVMTMHHWEYEEKLRLYKRINSFLKPNGFYIEGDYYATFENEKKFLKQKKILSQELKDHVMYHIDIPFHHSTQKKLLIEAGFYHFERVYVYKGKEVHVASAL